MPEKIFRIPELISDEDFDVLENGLRQLLGVRRVAVQRPTKEVTVRWEDPTTWRDIQRTLADLGYFPTVDDEDGDMDGE